MVDISTYNDMLGERGSEIPRDDQPLRIHPVLCSTRLPFSSMHRPARSFPDPEESLGFSGFVPSRSGTIPSTMSCE